MGGRNITIHIAVQSRAQLRQTVGRQRRGHDPQQRRDVAGVRWRGAMPMTSPRTQRWRGERHERTDTRDPHGKLISSTTQRVPVVPPSQFRAAGVRQGGHLPPRHGPGDRVGPVDLEPPRRQGRGASGPACGSPRGRARSCGRPGVRYGRSAGVLRRRSWMRRSPRWRHGSTGSARRRIRLTVRLVEAEREAADRDA